MESEQYVYETPDLVDSTTAPTSTLRSPSAGSLVDGLVEAGSVSGIDGRSVHVDQARATFAPSSRGRKKETTEFVYTPSRPKLTAAKNDFESDGDEPAPAVRLARLRQELEEVKLQIDNSKEPAKSEHVLAEVSQLEDLLQSVSAETDQQIAGGRAETRLAERQKEYDAAATAVLEPTADTTTTASATRPKPTPVDQLDQLSQLDAIRLALVKAGEFDDRLHQLETAIGLDGPSLPDGPAGPERPPILSTIALLDKQVALLISSPDALAAAGEHIAAVAAETEKLDETRRRQAADRASRSPFDAIAALRKDKFGSAIGSPVRQSSPGTSADPLQPSPGVDSDSASAAPGLDPAQIKKISALYETLPTIRSVANTVPLVLERLRTLRLIHNAAGSASDSLAEIDSRMADQRAEIESWKASLDALEAKLAEGEQVLKENVSEVGGWVNDLEARMDKLGR